MFRTIEGRGISNGNGAYFIFDAETDRVVMATYRDVPGVSLDRRQPNVVKTFSKEEWAGINDFIRAGAREDEDIPETFSNEFSNELDEDVVGKISEDDKEEVALPKVASSGDGIPSMSNSEENVENSGQASGEEATKVNGSTPESSEDAPKKN